MNVLLSKVGFDTKRQLYGFLSVVFSGQIIYSAFEAFKGTFYNLLLEVLEVDNTQIGLLFTLIGSAMFFYIPAGWVNNRFSVKKILMCSLVTRFLSMMCIILFQPNFSFLAIIAAIWGVTDAIFWPAVVNGVTIMSGDKNKGMAFGLLESIRRALEMSMNAMVVGLMAILGGTVFIFKGAITAYTLLIIPMIFMVWKFLPENKLEVKEGESKNLVALKGVLYVFKMPTVWLAALSSMTVYWVYIILIYTVPYLQAVFNLSTAQVALFGIINTAAMGVIAGVIAGSISDFVFRSSIKMMVFSLGLSSICMGAVILLPKTMDFLWVNIILLMAFSFSIFLAKGIILAPIAEAGVPQKFNGAAMSIGSFGAYSPVFWGYALNGWILDAHEKIIAYEYIFTIGMIVALLGACSSLLLVWMRKNNK